MLSSSSSQSSNSEYSASQTSVSQSSSSQLTIENSESSNSNLQSSSSQTSGLLSNEYNKSKSKTLGSQPVIAVTKPSYETHNKVETPVEETHSQILPTDVSSEINQHKIQPQPELSSVIPHGQNVIPSDIKVVRVVFFLLLNIFNFLGKW